MTLLPSQIQVGHLAFSVSRPAQIEGAIGTCREAELQIEVQGDLPPEQAVSTLLHEALHAVSYVHHARLTEAQVACLETGLALLLRDNPALVALFAAPKTSPVLPSWGDSPPRPISAR